MKQIRCGLLTIAPFPKGNVSTIRYSTYLSSLAKKGVFTKVYILSPTAMAGNNKEKRGVYKQIEFEYLSQITWKHKKVSFFTKVYFYLYGLLRSLILLKRDKITHVILYQQEYFSYIFYFIFLKVLKIKLIADKSEYPYGYSQMSKLKKKIAHRMLLCFDGFIVMTKELCYFYSEHKRKKSKIFHLPMTINSDRFDNILDVKFKHDYVASVFGTHNRDGIFDTIKSYFYYIQNYNSELDLVLIGDIWGLNNKEDIFFFIRENRLEKKIHFLGEVDINKVPSILAKARCLLSTANEYVSGGFPTKVGEYLLSSKPLIATKVGELPTYLKDQKDVYFVQPRDYATIAKKIYYIENNYSEALKIGLNGRKTALKLFNADSYVIELIDFFKDI